MTIRTIAEKIPAEYRKEILQLNMINQATASTMDAKMMYLANVWKNYINPDEDLSCGLCLQRILKNYQQLQTTFIEMEKQSKLLESL